MTNETITLVADSAPFWGVATTIWTIVAVVVFGMMVWIGIVVEDLTAAGAGFAVGVAIFVVGMAASLAGVGTVENASLKQQLQGVVQVENLEYNNKDFTGSIDGRYVKGTLVPLGDNKYQVVELVTTSKENQ